MASTPLLWWRDGYAEDPFFPVSTHLSPSWPPAFINSRRVTVGWFDSKIVIFLLQKCLGQKQLVTESLPQNGTGSPGGSGCAYPCPSLTHPASLSLGCPLPKMTCRGRLLLLPHGGRSCTVACALGGVAFSPFPLGIPD